MKRCAGSRAIFAGALFCCLAGPARAQMEVQIGPGPVDPNATPGSPLNPRNSLLRPQPVRPDPVNPSMQIPATPYPEALQPRTQIPSSGFTMTRKKQSGRKAPRKTAPNKAGPKDTRPSKIDWRAQVSEPRPEGAALERPGQISDALLNCWRPPALPVQQEVTVRLSFNRGGKVIGEPRITYVSGSLNASHREILRKSMLSGISACLPLRFTQGLASAIAGRPFAIRFIAPAQKPAGPSI